MATRMKIKAKRPRVRKPKDNKPIRFIRKQSVPKLIGR